MANILLLGLNIFKKLRLEFKREKRNKCRGITDGKNNWRIQNGLNKEFVSK
jgi:hypothetical protein